VDDATARHVVILGPMSSGKTSIGRLVAQRLGRELVDGDEQLEARTGGRTAADVADDEGIDALHEMEEQVVLDALGSSTPAVIGPAASVIESERVREQLRDTTLVWLTASPEYLAERAVKKSHRPLLQDGDVVGLFRRQHEVRDPLARPLAALVIDVSETSKRAAARAITDLVRDRR
jgi:shikimate kinase